jgi:flagella basal body P-ring formation protein FlgA
MIFFLFLALFACDLQGDIRLKKSVILENSRIKLGDFFDGIDADLAQKEVLDSPRIGEKLTLPSFWLKQLGSNFNIPWSPNPGEQITFTRGSRQYNARDLEKVVSQELQEQGETREFQINLHSSPQLEVSAGQDISFKLDYVQKDAEREVFKGALKIFEQGTLIKEINLEGRFQLVEQVPILNVSKHVGEIIHAADLEWRKIPLSNINGMMVTKQEHAIGFTPSHHPLKAGEFILKNKIEQPKIVKKNTEVTLLVQNPYMTISAKGQALEDGVLGASIRVTNIDSKKIIHGTVKSPTLVEVSMPMSSMVLGNAQ